MTDRYTYHLIQETTDALRRRVLREADYVGYCGKTSADIVVENDVQVIYFPVAHPSAFRKRNLIVGIERRKNDQRDKITYMIEPGSTVVSAGIRPRVTLLGDVA